MQTTLLGLAIALILALVAALVGPYFIDWDQFRPQFEAQATQVIGAPVRVSGKLDARLLPSPSLRLRSVVVGGANDLGKVRADKLDVEFSLGSLMRGEWRATELTIDGMALDLGLDPQGKIDLPAFTGKFNLGTLAIDRLNLTGRIALHDAASRGTLELNDIAFSGDVRSLAGAVRGDGNFMLSGTRYPFRVSSGQSADGNGTRVHLNIDPALRAFSADLEGVLSFESRAPRFEGAMTLAVPAAPKTKKGDNDAPTPWRITTRIKADPAAAKLEQIEVSYGAEDAALKFVGLGDVRFGAAPLLHATLSAKQLDIDKFAAKDTSAAEPIRLLPALRALIATAPEPPISSQIELSSEQIMLGGRPLQNFAADLRADAKSWTINQLDFRAPGTTRVSLSGSNVQPGPNRRFLGALSVESSDPDTLAAWLQGRSEVTYRNQKPMRLRGDVNVSADRVAIDAIKAEIDGGAVEGRIAITDHAAADKGVRVDAALKAERLDLDASTGFVRSLLGPQAEWPDEVQMSLDIGHAISSGQDLHPFTAKFGYGPKAISLDGLKIGEANGVMLDGTGAFDRVSATGKLALNSSAASLGQITSLIAPLAPNVAARLNAMGSSQGPARVKLALALDKDTERADRSNAHAALDIDAPQVKGSATITAKPEPAALRALDLDKLQRSEINIDSKLSSDKGNALLALLGLDGMVMAEGPTQFQGSVSGAWHAPLRLKINLSGNGLDAEAQGTAEPWAAQPKAALNLKAHNINLAPLFDLKPADRLMQNISLTSRVSLLAGKLSFDDLDGTIAGSRLRGRVSMTLDDERNVDGEIGLDAMDLAPAFALAIGSRGRDAAEPLGAGLLKGWHGRIAFQALRGQLPDGGELRPFSGTVRSDGQTLTLDALKGGIGGGQANATIDARQTANGIALNARLQLSNVDGAALHYRALKMPAGRASLQMTLASQGRSAPALTGAMSGNGTMTLESAVISGLDPRAFDVAIRASDAGQATNDTRLREIVDPVLAGGALLVASAQIPFTIRDGRLRVSPTTLDSDVARAIVSGGYDIPADQADIRATIASAAIGPATSRPEIQIFAAGSPDALDRTVDVAALSSWLAVRAIDRETRRLDSIERGEPAPPATPASIPPPPAQPPIATPSPAPNPITSLVPSVVPSAALPAPPASDAPLPEPRRVPPKPRIVAPLIAPRPPVALPSTNAPVVSQQVAPLPPPIEVRPAPGPAPRPPRPKPPLVLTPQFANPASPTN